MAYDDTLSVEAAFDRYEAIRVRLPAAGSARPSRSCSGLLEIADDFDAFVLDSFGVLNVGETAIPGAVDCLRALRERGKRLIVLTNAASYTRAVAVARYQSMGFAFTPEEVVSSRDVCAHRLNALGPDLRWGAIAAETDLFEDVEADIVAWSAEGADEVDAFLLLSSAAITPALFARLEDALTRRPRPVAVANPDLVAPRETGLSKEPGFFAHALVDRLGTQATFFGKPFGNAFEDALARLPGISPDRIAMVGDTLHTDILGGQAAGLRTVLVTDHGLFAGRAVDNFILRSGICPDFVCPSI